MQEKTIDLIGFGDPILDLVVHMDKFPETNTNGHINEYLFQGGGNVPTACVAGARLGLRTALVGCVGDDHFGKIGLSDLQYNGVDISHVAVRKGEKSNFCLCVTESKIGGKEFISKPGDFNEISVDELDEAFICSARMLHVAVITPAVARACDIIHRNGGKVSVDANYYRPYTYDYYDKIDIFIGSEMYYQAFCKDKGLKASGYRHNMQILSAMGPEIVIFTFGDQGCKGVYQDQYFEIPAFQVDVEDTTGAGDVFHGAFDYFYLNGYDVRQCAEYASGVSAIKCTRAGGRPGIPTLSALMGFMKTGQIDYSVIDTYVEHYKNGIM